MDTTATVERTEPEQPSENKTQLPATMTPGRGGGLSFTPAVMTQVDRFSHVLATGEAGIPKPFRNKPGLCLTVVCDALHWGMMPTQVIRKAYVVNDMVAYEAQLVHAVVNARAGLLDDLEVTYDGQGQERRCKVIGTLNRGKRQPREYQSPMVKDIKVKNSPLWQSDVDQQLHYFSTRNWARRWCPEVIMGVYTREEIEHGEVTEAYRVKAIEHEAGSDVLDDDPIADPNEPAPTAPLDHRLSYALEKCADEASMTQTQMAFQAEIDALNEKDRPKLRDLYKRHLKRARGLEPAEEVMAFSKSFRENK